MAATVVGRVRSGKGQRSYEVKWDHKNNDVYVSYVGWTYVGKAASAGDAMRRAEAWLYDK